MIPTALPKRPRQKVATDLFDHNGKTCIIVVDYHSRFFEVAPLDSTTTLITILLLKSFFCCHVIPEVLVSDNRLQFAAASFSKFAGERGFTHFKSSPFYSQSNREVERAVQTAKILVKKPEDLHLALLSYRSTPLENGYFIVELLMRRRIRYTLPMPPDKLIPKLPNLKQLQNNARSSFKNLSTTTNVTERQSFLT